MTNYYLIRGDQIISTIDSDGGDVLALPLLCGGDAMSVMNEQHAQNLMDNLSLSPAEALAALGIADLRDSMIRTVTLGPNPASVSGSITGIAAYHLIDVGDYEIWQCDGQQDDLLSLHAELWQMSPEQSLGLLAVVQAFGAAFHAAAVRTATGMTTQQALARRDRIASYLESLGHTDTAALRAATDEHTQMVGVVTALGYTEQQLWSAMVE
jgi:hypothetical protein